MHSMEILQCRCSLRSSEIIWWPISRWFKNFSAENWRMILIWCNILDTNTITLAERKTKKLLCILQSCTLTMVCLNFKVYFLFRTSGFSLKMAVEQHLISVCWLMVWKNKTLFWRSNLTCCFWVKIGAWLCFN